MPAAVVVRTHTQPPSAAHNALARLFAYTALAAARMAAYERDKCAAAGGLATASA